MPVHTLRRSGRSLAAAVGAVLVCAVAALSSTGAAAQTAPSAQAAAQATVQESRLDGVI